MSAPPQVAVVGGGYAGFAAAVTLARGGARVALFESSRTLGGRARVVDKDDYRVDNGQHILLGAYTETLRMLRLVGVKPGVLETRRLALVYPGECELRAAPLPAPRWEKLSRPTRSSCCYPSRAKHRTDSQYASLERPWTAGRARFVTATGPSFASAGAWRRARSSIASR